MTNTDILKQVRSYNSVGEGEVTSLKTVLCDVTYVTCCTCNNDVFKLVVTGES